MERDRCGQTRYARQMLLKEIGSDGQALLARARVLVIGCGALGSVAAELLARAGVGLLRIADRDIVEAGNLHRQILFAEQDALDMAPKAEAAARRLASINSSIRIEPLVADVNADNIERICGLTTSAESRQRVDLILDGTDNVETRYLINDVAVKHNVRWIYAGCVATEGRVMAVLPGKTPCLRCIFRDPPRAGELPTCDTVGVLGPAAAATAAMQAALAIRLLCHPEAAPESHLISLDVWRADFRVVSLPASPDEGCPCCGQRRFEFLESERTQRVQVLCGQNSVQLAPAPGARFDMEPVAERLRAAGKLTRTPYFSRCELEQPDGLTLIVFADGRMIVHGTQDVALARSIVARFVGT